MHPPRPTLEMVAARAGVSRATVSRVINGSPSVAAHLRETVMRAVDALGYVPNPAARSLVTQRTDSYALVVPEPTNRVFSDDPFFSLIIRGVSHELEAADKQLVLMLANSAWSHRRVFAVAGHVDGVMFASMHGADPLPATLARMGVPVVCNERPLVRHAALPYVGVDNVGGAETATRHLVATGRTRIASIAGPQDMVGGIDRLTGYRRALRGSASRSIVAVGDFTRESGAAAMGPAPQRRPAPGRRFRRVRPHGRRRAAGLAARRPAGARRRRRRRLRRRRVGPLHGTATDHGAPTGLRHRSGDGTAHAAPTGRPRERPAGHPADRAGRPRLHVSVIPVPRRA